ncbi:hypothetical protein ABH905_003897 [Pseudomonas frederiksbergensis]
MLQLCAARIHCLEVRGPLHCGCYTVMSLRYQCSMRFEFISLNIRPEDKSGVQ